MLTDEPDPQESRPLQAVPASGDTSPGAICLHDVLPEVTERVRDGEISRVVVVDGRPLESWELEHGPRAFDTLMAVVERAATALPRDLLGPQHIVCLDAPGSDTLLMFGSASHPKKQEGDSPAGQPDDAAFASRVKSKILEHVDGAVDDRIISGIEQMQVASMSIPGSTVVDPRRQIYRSIRRARTGFRNARTKQRRRRHETIGEIIADEHIETRFQPIVDLETGDVIAFEALSKPDSTAFNDLPDDKLFDAARKAELDSELDRLCRRLSIERHPTLGSDTNLFVNCLPEAFCNPLDELSAVLDTWADEGFKPEQLVFEINENITHHQAEHVLPTIRELRSRGYRFALDDMGTGTTNLRVLADLEPDFIKMDISLTAGIGSNLKKKALASYLLDLADASDAALIAEGLESHADLQTVRELGLHLGQGYLFDSDDAS